MTEAAVIESTVVALPAIDADYRQGMVLAEMDFGHRVLRDDEGVLRVFLGYLFFEDLHHFLESDSTEDGIVVYHAHHRRDPSWKTSPRALNFLRGYQAKWEEVRIGTG